MVGFENTVNLKGNDSFVSKSEAKISLRDTKDLSFLGKGFLLMRPCINCSGTNLVEGEIKGDGNVHPKNKFLSLGSPLLITICLECGEVIQ